MDFVKAADSSNLPEIDFLTIMEYLKRRDKYTAAESRQEKDCLHLQLYRDSKDRYKQGQTKASLSLQHFLGVETGFTLDKESNTIAILCQDVTVVLAFDTRERLIQWQVKIANNLGDDQQYLIQVGGAPGRAKIAPGPARLHLQDYRFSLTTGVPPRLIGVWNISQLRKFGVVESSRFVFEGGSGCGRLEGPFILVTDQGQEICQAMRVASQGKLLPKRKHLARNMSVLESPRKQQSSTGVRPKLLSRSSTELLEQQHQQRSTVAAGLWAAAAALSSSQSSSYVPASGDFGDTVSVSDLLLESQEGWSGEEVRRCSGGGGCLTSKIGSMTRSLTVSNTPGTGFNPAWIMETKSCEHHIRKTICCNFSLISHTCHSTHSGEMSPITTSCKTLPEEPPGPRCVGGGLSPGQPSLPAKLSSGGPVQTKALPSPLESSAVYENYDTPRSLAINLREDRLMDKRHSMASSSELEYYDTPKKLKDSISSAPSPGSCPVSSSSPLSSQTSSCLCQQTSSRTASNILKCSCQPVVVCQCGTVCPTTPIVICPCSTVRQPSRIIRSKSMQAHLTHGVCSNGDIYALVDKLKKTKRKLSDVTANESRPISELDESKDGGGCLLGANHYENLHFAQSLEHYENVKDVMVVRGVGCRKCRCGGRPIEDDYLPMGPPPAGCSSPVGPRPACSSPPPTTNCRCTGQLVFSDARSAASSPVIFRRRDSTSAYLTEERRRMAQIRRRSNSMDSGGVRVAEGLECITERTASSQNTLTGESNSGSIDSLPSSEKAATGESYVQHHQTQLNHHQQPLHSSLRLPLLRRASGGPTSKANRDSSSSNDSGVSTGSLKNFGAGFLEFETLVTPLSKVRAQSLGATRELPLAKSRSSEGLLSASDFHRPLANVKTTSPAEPAGQTPGKSSSAEAEVPLCQSKKQESKDNSVSSSSSRALTIPYQVDSVSTSSGASDMSDYIDTVSMSSFSSSEHDNLRQCHSVATLLRPRSGKEYQKIDRINIDEVRQKLSRQHIDSPSPGYGSSTSSN